MEIPRRIGWKQESLAYRGGCIYYAIQIFHDKIEYEDNNGITPVILDNKRLSNITEERILMAERLTHVLSENTLPGGHSHMKDWLVDFLTM